jgi:pimeloyl-ACP methyl ester carboxylesterase
MVTLTACSAEPSLTAAELASQHPDKTYMEIDGVSLHYEQQGLGRPLILLHGFSTSSHVWRNITPGLTYGTTVYTLDLMGFGFSEKPQDRSYNIETYITQLGAFLDRLNLQNPMLGGQGIGALIATLYTIRNPDKVRKLILVGAPLYDASPSFNVRLLGFPVVGPMLTGDWFLKRLWRNGVEDQERMSDLALKPYLAPYQNDPGARATLRKLVQEFDAQSVIEQEIRPNLSTLDLPTLLIWGPYDAEVPLEVGRQLDREIPHSDITVILGSGHYVQEERPTQVRVAIKEFVHQ